MTTGPKAPKPPRLPRALLLLIPRADQRELIRADLDEEYRRVAGERGRVAAALRLWWGAADSVADWWFENVSWKSFRSRLVPDGLRRTGLRSGGWCADLRFSLRMIRREPIVSAAVLATVVIGVGATTAVASLLRGVLVRPLPFPDPDRIVRISRTSEGVPAEWPVVGVPDMLAWREQSSTMAAVAGWGGGGATLPSEGGPEHVSVASVTEGLPTVLGLRPAAGRFFVPEEYSPEASRVVLLSHGMWTARFGGDPSIVGRNVILDGVPHRVVGVLPDTDFEYPADYDVWIPLAPPPDSWMLTVRGASWLNAVGRVRGGTSVVAAERELSAIQARLVEAFPRDAEGQDGVHLEPLKDVVVAPARAAIRILSLVVAGVLLLACANVGVLLLSRANRRRSEFALRSVLGGGPVRQLRLLLTETGVLAVIGGVVGILVASPLAKVIAALYPGGLPRAAEIRLDPVVLGVSVLTIGLAALAAGGVPALTIRRLNPAGELERRGAVSPGRRQQRFRNVLAVAQMGLSAALLIGAALFVRTLLNLRSADPGFEPAGVLSFRIAPAEARYPNGEALASFYRRLLDELERLPGVERTGAVNFLPFTAGEWGGGFEISGEETQQQARVRISWPGYYESLGVPIVRGRAFDWRDDASGPPVALLNEAAARSAFPDQDPLGQQIEFEGAVREVVGMVGDVRHTGIAEEPAPEVHVPGAQFARHAASVVLRARVEPLSLLPAARSAVADLDPSIAVTDAASMSDRIEASFAPERFRATLIAGLGLLAALLALIGVYGVMSYTVAQRRREIGIRVALGEPLASVRLRVLRAAGWMSGTGVVVGALIAWGASRGVQSLLFEVEAQDGAVFTIVPVALFVAGLAAALGPAIRASRQDPLAVIREE